jgi:Pyruvate/2-oxoacid:ferredoxin oxidoreductase gamma subunit
MNKKLKLPEGGLFETGIQEVKKESDYVSKGVIEIESENIVSKAVCKKESIAESKVNNSLTITRKKVTQYTIPMTYRLRAETIETIRENARIANMGVAEYLQAVLDLVLDKIEIK